MFGFAYGIPDKNHVLVEPFSGKELVKVYGSEAQIEDIRRSLRQRDRETDPEPVMVFFEEQELELAEEGIMYESISE